MVDWGLHVLQVIVHERVDAVVVSGRRQDDMAVFEAVGDQLGYMGLGDVVHPDIFYACLSEGCGEDLSHVLCVPVHGSVGDHDAFFLRLISAPDIIFPDDVIQVRAPDRSVEGADDADIKPGGFFQHVLHLHAVFADDICIVAASLVQPLSVKIKFIVKDISVHGAKGPEGVSGEEDFVCLIVRHHRLRPVHHRSHDEVESVLSGREGVPFLYGDCPAVQVKVKELADHGEGLCVSDELHIRIAQDQFFDHSAVVRFHVVHYEIIQGASVQCGFYVLKELAADGIVRGVKKDSLLIKEKIGIVRDSLCEREDVFEELQPPVAAADPVEILSYFSKTVHDNSSLCNGRIRRGQTKS